MALADAIVVRPTIAAKLAAELEVSLVPG
jgi:hypothetical protein